MGRNKQKTKGNRWERDFAKHLSEVFDMNFLRVPSSGAYTGGANVHRVDKLTESQRRMMSGDIIIPDGFPPYKFECKNYNDFDFHKLYKASGNPTLNDWIKQTRDSESDSMWFIAVSVGRKVKLVVFPCTMAEVYKIPRSATIYDGAYIICNLEGFFEANKDIILATGSNAIGAVPPFALPSGSVYTSID